MTLQEIPFEKFGSVLEATRSTAIATPTHLIPAKGRITPKASEYEAPDAVGTLEEFIRSTQVRRWGEWETDDFPLDVNYVPFIANRVVKGGITAPQAAWVDSGITPASGPITKGTKGAAGSSYNNTGTAVLSAGTGLTGADIMPVFVGGALTAVVILAPGAGCTLSS